MTALTNIKMYDAVNPANIPSDAKYVGGYGDGLYNWMATHPELFPNAHKFIFVVFANHDGDCLDVEKGNATPAQAPGWAVRQRARGKDPFVYCSRLGTYGWQAVQDAFNSQRVPHPHYGIADYSTPPGTLLVLNGISAVFHQYVDTGLYDISILTDTFISIVGGSTVELTDKLPNGASIQEALMDRMAGKMSHWTMVPDSTAAFEVKTLNDLTASVKSLLDSVAALTTEVAALKGAQAPQVAGTFTITGSGSVAPS